MLADVELTYQNLDSVELGVTTIDHYFDTLGGISRAVRRAKGGVDTPVYIGCLLYTSSIAVFPAPSQPRLVAA